VFVTKIHNLEDFIEIEFVKKQYQIYNSC
jgi:hypothetical protein